MKRSVQLATAALMLAVTAAPVAALAETKDFGGYPERFKGGGDKIPPRCQIDVPTTATEPFFVKWNCTDDNADPSEIRTELWLYRNGAQTGELIANFLGFPASVQIDQGLLHVANFTDGMPVSVKLLARDRAGIATISPLFTIRAQDNAVTQCELAMHMDSADSSGSTTGSPAADVDTGEATVSVTQSSVSQLGITTKGGVAAQPCEIDAVCGNDTVLTFSSSLTLGSGGSAGKAEGTVSIVPGSLVVPVSGSASVESAALQSVNVTGTTTIDGRSTTVTLTCSR